MRLGRCRSIPRPVPPGGSITLRLAAPGDRAAIARLDELDSSPPPAEPVLLVEVEGELRAARSLLDHSVVADPFHPTVELVALLHQRARQILKPPRARRGGGEKRLAQALPGWR